MHPMQEKSASRNPGAGHRGGHEPGGHEIDVRPIDALADEAAEWVNDQIWARYSDPRAAFGTWERHHSPQDVRYHVEFLVAALETSAPECFVDYVRWLSTVLRSRGVPVEMLSESLSLILKFWESRLDVALASRTKAIIDAGMRAVSGETGASKQLYQYRMPEPMPQVEALTQCMLRGDARAARSLMLQRVHKNVDYLRIATHLFQPALYRIGELWERNEITVAGEHLATAIIRTLMVECYMSAKLKKPVRRKALLAGVEQNRHVLGLRMVADAYCLAGWSVQYLGADTPTQALIAQTDVFRPDIVGLSASLVQQLRTMKRAIEGLRSELGSQCPAIIVGGIPTNQIDQVWRWVGADEWNSDAEKVFAEAA